MSSVHTYPPTTQHKIMTSNVRALTEPASAGFMRRRHDMNDFDDQLDNENTQEGQDTEDKDARKQAMRNLVDSWQERLQLISVITTFFASTEAAMLTNTKPSNPDDWENRVLLVANASLLGALIMHVYASVLSFLGAFLLISYKLREARREEMILEGIQVTNSPLKGSVAQDVGRGSVEQASQHIPAANDTQSTICEPTETSVPVRNKRKGLLSFCPLEPPIFSTAGRVGPFKSKASSHHLLSRTHALCIFLAGVGFILNAVGILSYCWALLPIAVGIFASACLGGALLTMLALRI